MDSKMNRRIFLAGGATLLSAAVVSKSGIAAVPEAPMMTLANTQAAAAAAEGPSLQPRRDAKRVDAPLAHE
jgi:hypothetical protein